MPENGRCDLTRRLKGLNILSTNKNTVLRKATAATNTLHYIDVIFNTLGLPREQ